jgi:hypothetical protein
MMEGGMPMLVVVGLSRLAVELWRIGALLNKILKKISKSG